MKSFFKNIVDRISSFKNSESKNEKEKNRDFAAKICCLVGAVLIWFYAVSAQTIIEDRKFVSIPVDIIGVDTLETESGMTVINGYDYTVDVTVSGTRSALNKIGADDIDAYVDVSQIAASGDHTLDVRTTVPGNVSQKELSTNYVNVYVDKRESRNVQIKINPLYSIESDLTLGTPAADFETITVSGPGNVLDMIEYAQVTLELGKLTKSITATGDIVLVGKDGGVITNPYVKLSRSEITVTVPVYAEKEVPLTVEFRYGYYDDSTARVTIVPQTILLRGDPTVLSGINDITVLTVDEKKMVGTTNTRTVMIELPDGVENRSKTESATVTVTHMNTSTREINVQGITVKNPNGLDYTLVDDSINVTLRGSSGSLAMVTPANIGAQVDLSFYSRGSGRVSVPVIISLPSTLSDSVYEIGDYTIDVEIK